jgi:NAD(P)-dependent dehydrogenase (short-subunit alcohol dehydrogenase family)
MATETQLDLVTGAFSYSGSHIAQRLLDAGHRVRTLSFHPCRPHPLQASVQAFRYDFDDATALARSFEGVATFYNTYWVRFDHGRTSFGQAVERSLALFSAAQALDLLVRDVVLTPDEIDGLMAGLLVSDNPPLGQIPFSSWLHDSKTSVRPQLHQRAAAPLRPTRTANPRPEQ